MLRIKTLILGLVLSGWLAAPAAEAESDAETGAWLGLLAGASAGSETQLAADMASLFAPEAPLRVRPMLGDAGAGNIALLLDDPRVDLAFVSIDALAEAQAADGNETLTERLELVARLCPQEIHVLARSGIGNLSGLAGKKVGVGPTGSSSAISAASLFSALGIEIEPLNLDAGTAMARLEQGSIAASVIVGAKPMPLVAGIAANRGIHLLPVPFGAPLEMAYLPARMEQADYPNLIPAGAEIATVATGMVLLAAKAKGDQDAVARIARFVDTVFSRFAELQAPSRHPKWREVNLAASLPGFARSQAAEAWLNEHPASQAKPIAASAGAAPVLPESVIMSKEEKEALFERFIEWQRAKGH